MTASEETVDPDAFAEGMEAAHCGLLIKDGPRGRKTFSSWRLGYMQALRDRAARADRSSRGEEDGRE